MSLSRSNCTLLGFGASPPPVDGAVVLGGAASVCYLGGSAPGATVSAAALSLKAGTQLVTAAGTGAAGAPLLSGGAGGAPAWSATAPFYVYSSNSTLAAGTSGQRAFLKNSSSGSITVAGTGTGFVVGTAAAVSTLTLAGGASVMLTSNGTNWLQTYQSVVPPTVTSVSPNSGPLAGGTSITITGTAFTGATAVTVGGVAATSVTVNSGGTSITATTPVRLTTGTTSVNVTTPGGTSSDNTLYSYTAAVPTVASVSPASGPLTGSTVLTITGTAFTGTTAVTVGGVAATSVTVVSDTSITATAPAGTLGTASVNVTTPGGTSAANSLYSYAAVPTVTSVSPASGPLAGGTMITITGTAFTGATAVMVGGVAATSVTVNSGGTSITATTPVRLTTGSVSVTVTTPGGTSVGNLLYSYTAAVPTVTSVSPASGPLTGGASITITGTAFTGATAVTVGGAAATTVTVISDTSITATTPAGTLLGSTSVNVTTPGGTSADNNTLYSYIVAVTSITPSYSLLAGGGSITITGAGFTNASAVTIGGADATSFTVNGAGTEITATAPAGTAGAASVLVTTPAGTNAANDLFTYYETTSTYNYTGANQECVVPFNCTISASVAGSAGTWGGNGAVITGNFTASARSKLTVVVGHYNSTYAGGSTNIYNAGGGGGYSAVIDGPSTGGNVNSVGIPTANEPSCIYIMAGGGGASFIGGSVKNPSGGLWNSAATPMSQGGAANGGYTTDYAGNGAGGPAGTSGGTSGSAGNKFHGGASNSSAPGGGSGYYGGGSGSSGASFSGGGSSYVNVSVTAVTSAATNQNAGTVTLTVTPS